MSGFQEGLERAVANGVPALAAAFATRRGEGFCGAAGHRCVAAGDPLHSDSIFRIASMTKAITSFAALQLVDEGRVDLDDEMTQYFPELGDRQVLEGFDAAGAPRLRPAQGAITLRQLLTHTAGFGYSFLNAELLRAEEAGMMGGFFDGDDRFLAAPLVRDPGSVWEYGISTDWVGRLVEALRDESLGDVCRARIFEPLGMPDTAFNLPADKHARVVTVHHRGADGGLREDPDQAPPSVSFHAGGGGLYSTAHDYLRFLQAVLGGGACDGARILSEALCAEAGRDQIAPLRLGAFKSANADLINDVDDLAGSAFGLGFALNPEPFDTGRSAGSLAWAGLFNSYYWVDPARGVTGVVLAQILPFYDPAVVEAAQAFETAVYASQ